MRNLFCHPGACRVKRIFVTLGVTDVWAKERWQFGEWADRLVVRDIACRKVGSSGEVPILSRCDFLWPASQPHPEYNPNEGSPNIRAHDIALIRLRRPAPIGRKDNVGITLWPVDTLTTHTPVLAMLPNREQCRRLSVKQTKAPNPLFHWRVFFVVNRSSE